MRRFFTILFLVGLLGSAGICAGQVTPTPTPSPSVIGDLGFSFKYKDAARNPYRDKGEGMRPIGARDFIFYGGFESDDQSYKMRIGNTEVEGYPKKPMGSGLAPKNKNLYLARLGEDGGVKWTIVSKEGNGQGNHWIHVNVVGEEVYVLLALRPTQKPDRAADDKTVLVLENSKGAKLPIVDPNMEVPANLQDFIPYVHCYLIKVGADASMELLGAPIVYDGVISGTQSKQGWWLEVQGFHMQGDRMLIGGRLKNAKAKVGMAGTTQLSVEGRANDTDRVFWATLKNGVCEKVVNVVTDHPYGAETLSASVVDESGVYFSMRLTNPDSNVPSSVALAGTTLAPHSAVKMPNEFLVKMDWELKGILWHKLLPERHVARAMYLHEGMLYVGGKMQSEVQWGSTIMLPDPVTKQAGYFGMLKAADGEYVSGRVIFGGAIEIVDISVDNWRTYIYFGYNDYWNTKADGGTEVSQAWLNFGDGFDHVPIKSWGKKKWGKSGLAIYTKGGGKFLSFSRVVDSDKGFDVPYYGGRLSNDGMLVSYFSQPQMKDGSKVYVFGEEWPTPEADLYGGFISLYQVLQLPTRYGLSVVQQPAGMGGVMVSRDGVQLEAGENLFEAGDLLTVTATEVEGYTPSLNVGGATLDGTSYKVTGDVTVTVTYTPKSYSLAVTSSLEGQGGATVKLGENVIMPGAGVVAHDQQVSIVPIAVDGYQLILEVTGAVRVAEGSPLYRVTGDVKVHVRYVQGLYSLAVQSSLSNQGGAMVKRGEYVVAPGNGVVASGDLLTITAVDVEGYTAEVKVEGATLEGATYKVTGNVTVTVTYTLKSYSLAIVSSLEGQGGVTVKRGDDPVTAGDAVVKHGDMLTIAAVDVEGYTAEVKVEGAVLEGTSYKVTGNVSVTVTYTLKTYSLAITSSLEGQGGATVKRGEEAVIVGDAAVRIGDALTITVVEVEGYAVELKVEGAVLEGTSYKVTGNVTVMVTYTLKSYSLAIVSSLEGQGGATVKRGEEAIAAGDAAVKHGDLLSVEAMTIADYTAEVKVEGATLEGKTYKVSGNVTVTVTYTRITFTVTQLSHRGKGSLRLLRGTAEVKEGATINSGELLNLEVQPAEGYVVRSGSLRIEGLAIQGSVYKVTGNVKVSIDFDPEPKRTPVIDGTLDRPTLQVNPVVSMLVVQKAAQVAHYALYDAVGRAVLTGQHDGADELVMDVASLRSGLYLLTLRAVDGQTFTLRVVKR